MSASRRPSPLNCEPLEDRATPAAAYALSGSTLLAFDTAAPATTTATAITGVAANEALVGLDFRAADGALYALGVNAGANTATLYTVSTDTGAAAAVGAPGGVKFVDAVGTAVDLPDPAAAGYGLDFDAADRLRVVTANGLNFRIDPTTGAAVDGDTGLAGAVTGVNTDGALNGLPAGSTGVGAAAHTGAALYTLDAASDSLFVQDTPGGGTQTARVNLTRNGAPLDFTRANGFDISDDGAFAALTVNNVTRLYKLDLTTGAATDLGAAPAGATGLALAPAAGAIAFAGAQFTATEAGLAAEVTLTRTGGTAGAVSVTVTTTDGTATAGPDFMPGPYTVAFAHGQATATLLIPLDNLDAAEGDESFTLALSAPTGRAALGAQSTATVTISDGGVPSPVPVPAAPPALVVGTGAGAGAVNVLNADGSVRSGFLPYGAGFLGGVRVATGDVTGDGVADVITAPAVGAAHVKVFDGVTGAEVRSFLAFAPGFLGGLTVASGDVDGDGTADIVVGTASGASHVKVFSGATGGDIHSFFAFGGFTGGVTVAAGDVNGDGRADIVVGTASATSHVKVFAGGSLAVLQSTFAFVGHSGGVNVAAGDVDGDGKADVIVGTAGGAAQVRVYSGATRATLHNFRAFPLGYNGGVSVSARDANGDGRADLFAGTAAGASHVKGFDGGTAAEVNSFLAFGAGFGGGVFVA